MERWIGKIAVVTGASAGIGSAIVKDLAKAGVIVIGLARRLELVEAIKQQVPNDIAKNIHAYHCDVSNEQSILSAFDWVEKKFGAVHILINNAGLAKYTMLLDPNNGQNLTDTVNTNILGLLFCTREAFKSMSKRDDDLGYIININSFLGHKVTATPPNVQPSLNIYPGSKHAVTASSEVIRQELNFLKKDNIRVSSLSPGMVRTDFSKSAGRPNADVIYDINKALNPEDVSQGILYILSTPPHVQVYELTLKPVGEKF